jgi:hypothetical protein
VKGNVGTRLKRTKRKKAKMKNGKKKNGKLALKPDFVYFFFESLSNFRPSGGLVYN